MYARKPSPYKSLAVNDVLALKRVNDVVAAIRIPLTELPIRSLLALAVPNRTLFIAYPRGAAVLCFAV
jgi:hypothetical protein